MIEIKRTIGAMLRRWGTKLDPEGAFQDEVAADIRRRLARDPLRNKHMTVTSSGGGGGSRASMGAARRTQGTGWEVIEIGGADWTTQRGASND